MEDSNKEDAQRAMKLAEKKLLENDYNGAKIFANKAQNLYPKLEGLEQVSMMIDVYLAASNNGRGESDWYGILGVDPLASVEALKKQYKKLALLLHPDKNMYPGAEDAFKLVLEAWSILSDEIKRLVYDYKRSSLNEVKPKKKRGSQQKSSFKPYETASSSRAKADPDDFEEESGSQQKPSFKPYDQKASSSKAKADPDDFEDEMDRYMDKVNIKKEKKKRWMDDWW